MLLKNQWQGGSTKLVFPPLPPHLAGQSGCQIFKATFDSEVGDEGYLLMLDTDAGWTETLSAGRGFFGGQKPLLLFALTGAVETSQGWVGFILWQLFRGTKRVAWWEQYLNPFNPATISLLRSTGDQTHLKTVLIASDTGRTRDFVEYENSFELGQLGGHLADIAAKAEPCDFALAQQAFMSEVSVEELLQTPIQMR